MDETTVYAFSLWISDTDTAMTHSDNRRRRHSAMASESSKSGVTMVAGGIVPYSRSPK